MKVGLIQGVGYNNGEYPAKVDGKNTKIYKLWGNMLRRCYNEKEHLRNPTYIGCTVSENFKSYSYFHGWCEKQVGFGLDGFALDKDLLVKGNKFYSEDTCVFIPQNLNKLLIKRDKTRGELPIGVALKSGYKSKPYVTYCCDGLGKKIHLGYYSVPTEAFLAYKEYKENLIKQLAKEYKGQIDERAYQALMNYEVSVDD